VWGVVALAAVIVVGSQSMSWASVPTAGKVSESTDALLNSEQTLLESIPSDQRYGCYAQDPSRDKAATAQAASIQVKCDNPADGIDDVVYLKFATAADLAASYAASSASDLPQLADGDTTTCPGKSAWSYHGTSSGGQFSCSAASDGASMIWTADDQLIEGFATASDGATIRQWFNSSSGPLQTPETVTDFADTGKKALAAEKALKKSVAKVASGCKSVVDVVAPGDLEWGWMPWIDTAISCNVGKDGHLYTNELTPQSAKPFEAALTKEIIGTDDVTRPGECKDGRDVMAGKKTVGAIECFVDGDGIFAVWYASDTGTTGSLRLPAKKYTPTQLLDYLDQHKLI
jgi:hypothetical protein